jgi:hypothetical protein
MPKHTEEIDKTLDQLIRNAEAISNANFQDLSDIELEAFKKTQESLLNHLLLVDSLQDKRTASQKIFQKRRHFQLLQQNYTQELAILDQKPYICKKRRRKKFLNQ